MSAPKVKISRDSRLRGTIDVTFSIDEYDFRRYQADRGHTFFPFIDSSDGRLHSPMQVQGTLRDYLCWRELQERNSRWARLDRPRTDSDSVQEVTVEVIEPAAVLAPASDA
jgi:hypothetical protein